MSYTLQANHDDTASCALKTTASYIPSVGQSFYVYESVDAENKYGGVINSVTLEKIEAGTGTSKTIKADITVSPFKAIASRRTVAYSETAVTAKTIVQKVISALTTEGVTEGTVNTGASDIGEYDAPLSSCSQVMDDMCIASGYQWWIDPDKLLHFYNFDLIISAPYTVTETGNYTVNSYTYDIDQYANKIFVQGSSDVSAVITRQDTAEQTLRASIEGGSGVYGAVISDENIVTETDANAAGDAALKWAGIIPQKLMFTAYDNLSSWYPGYRVTASFPSIGLTASGTFNIDSVTTADQGNYFTATVNCSIRKSSDFSTAHAQTGIEYLAKVVSGASSGGGSYSSPATVNVNLNKTLALTDANTIQNVDSISSVVITVPPNTSVAFAVDTEIAVIRYGEGSVTIAKGSGVTVNSPGAKLQLYGQYTTCALKKIATDEWLLVGALKA